MEEARLLKLQAQVYQRSGNTEETLKTLTRAKDVQSRWDEHSFLFKDGAY